MIINKEKGYTSHDVVAKLRGILHQKKIGHTGTLDPEATGVLPVCLGKGTKLCELLTDKEKTYRALCRLGIETDTQDMTGQILQQHTVVVTKKEVEECVASFLGEYAQIPPMYSALKKNGKKLYELAREGITVEREPRKVFIREAKIIEWQEEAHTFLLEVTCSKGTYIRTLCHDIGQKLGCGAAMEELVRTRVAAFTLEMALSLSDVEALTAEDRIGEVVIAIDDMFQEYGKRYVKEESCNRLYNGNPLYEEDFCKERDIPGIKAGTEVLVYDMQGRFIAIYERKEKDYKPLKMFYGKTE